jgi:hypothetical protein
MCNERVINQELPKLLLYNKNIIYNKQVLQFNRETKCKGSICVIHFFAVGKVVSASNKEAVIAVVKLCAMKGTINQDILALFEMRSGRKEVWREKPE